MAKLVNIRGLDAPLTTGHYMSKRGFRIKNSSGAQVIVDDSATVTVDVQDASVRRTLKRNAWRWISLGEV